MCYGSSLPKVGSTVIFLVVGVRRKWVASSVAFSLHTRSLFRTSEVLSSLFIGISLSCKDTEERPGYIQWIFEQESERLRASVGEHTAKAVLQFWPPAKAERENARAIRRLMSKWNFNAKADRAQCKAGCWKRLLLKAQCVPIEYNVVIRFGGLLDSVSNAMKCSIEQRV